MVGTDYDKSLSPLSVVIKVKHAILVQDLWGLQRLLEVKYTSVSESETLQHESDNTDNVSESTIKSQVDVNSIRVLRSHLLFEELGLS